MKKAPDERVDVSGQEDRSTGADPDERRALDLVEGQAPSELSELSPRRPPAALRRLPEAEPRRRRRVGERTIKDVGRRMWERPDVAVSGRLFKIYGLADPWLPTSRVDKDPIPLGPVNLRLGKKRRQPAPHLRPKAEKKKKTPQQAVDPLAKWRRPAGGSPKPAPKAPPKPPPRPPKPASELSREFGGGDAAGRRLVGNLPVRPEVKAAMEAAAKDEEAAPQEVARRLPPMPKPQRRASSQRVKHSAPPARERRANAAAPRPTPPAAPEGEPVERRLPPVMPPGGARSGKRRGRGRFSLRAQASTSAPVVTEVSPVVSEEAETAPPEPEYKPVERRLPGAAGGSGMDDLFGMAMEGGRMRFGAKKKDAKD